MSASGLLGLADFGAAIAEALRGLAESHARELGAETLEALRGIDYPQGIALRLVSKTRLESAGQLRQALRPLEGTLVEATLQTLAADYAGIYLSHRYRASPCESVWTDADGLTHQQAMFSIRTWYRRHRPRVADWRACRERRDHRRNLPG